MSESWQADPGTYDRTVQPLHLVPQDEYDHITNAIERTLINKQHEYSEKRASKILGNLAVAGMLTMLSYFNVVETNSIHNPDPALMEYSLAGIGVVVASGLTAYAVQAFRGNTPELAELQTAIAIRENFLSEID